MTSVKRQKWLVTSWAGCRYDTTKGRGSSRHLPFKAPIAKVKGEQVGNLVFNNYFEESVAIQLPRHVTVPL